MSVFLPKNRILPASYNYLSESKTDKSLTIYTQRKGFASDIFIQMNFSDQGTLPVVLKYSQKLNLKSHLKIKISYQLCIH